MTTGPNSIMPFCFNPLVRCQRAVTHCGNESCAEDLSRCVSDPIPKDTLKMVGLLGDVASGRINEHFPDLPESFKKISLGDLVRLISFLSTPLLHDKNDLSQECSACESLKITEDTLTAWPRGYYQYLHQLACQMLAHIKHSDTFTPTRVFTAKYSLLSFENSATFLHVGRSVIRSLVQAGYVETLTHRGTTWCKVSSMNNLLGKLAKIATHSPVYDSPTIELCFCCLSVSASNVLDVIERALNGKFRLIDKGVAGACAVFWCIETISSDSFRSFPTDRRL